MFSFFQFVQFFCHSFEKPFDKPHPRQYVVELVVQSSFKNFLTLQNKLNFKFFWLFQECLKILELQTTRIVIFFNENIFPK